MAADIVSHGPWSPPAPGHRQDQLRRAARCAFTTSACRQTTSCACRWCGPGRAVLDGKQGGGPPWARSGQSVNLGGMSVAELRILGPLDLRGPTGSAPLGGDKPRRLLGALALHASEVVPADRLIEIAWGDSPPRS